MKNHVHLANMLGFSIILKNEYFSISMISTIFNIRFKNSYIESFYHWYSIILHLYIAKHVMALLKVYIKKLSLSPKNTRISIY